MAIKWHLAIKGAKKSLIEKRIAKTEYDKTKELPTKFDAKTTVYFKDGTPVLKVVHKTQADTYNAYLPFKDVYK